MVQSPDHSITTQSFDRSQRTHLLGWLMHDIDEPNDVIDLVMWLQQIKFCSSGGGGGVNSNADPIITPRVEDQQDQDVLLHRPPSCINKVIIDAP